jgi:Tfp pilus assembly protein FimT
MILVLGTLATVPWLARETMRGALHDAGTLLRVARTEAVKRSHDCRFIVDLSARTMSVVDTNGTSNSSDDLVLRRTRLPSVVSVARPDEGSAITFAEASGSVYLVQFDPGGYVSSGAGEMVLYGGECYRKLVVHSAGGVGYERWNGSSWAQGS